MDKKNALDVVKELKKNAVKRKFVQAVDVIVNLQDLDFKKPDHQLDFYVTLPNSTGKKKRIAAFVDADLFDAIPVRGLWQGQEKDKEAC